MKRSSWLARTLTGGLVLLCATAASGRDRSFDDIVHRLEAHYHARPVRFMGLASFLANRARPEGVRNMRLAVFEDLDPSQSPSGSEFDSFLQDVVGPEFKPFVRVLSRRDGERTYVYMREIGNSCELLVVNFERDEASVIQMRMKPDAMSDWFDEPAQEARHSAHDAEREP